MTKKDRDEIINWAKDVSDGELESEYYAALDSSLGSSAECIYHRATKI